MLTLRPHRHRQRRHRTCRGSETVLMKSMPQRNRPSTHASWKAMKRRMIATSRDASNLLLVACRVQASDISVKLFKASSKKLKEATDTASHCRPLRLQLCKAATQAMQLCDYRSHVHDMEEVGSEGLSSGAVPYLNLSHICNRCS